MNRHHKKLVSAICILLAVLMALSLILMVIPARAISESDIEEIQRKRAALAEELEQQAALIQDLSDNHALIIDRKAALDRQIALNRTDISLLEEEIQAYDTLVEEMAGRLTEARAAEVEQTEALRERMRAMEESGDYSYLEFVFAATSLPDMLSRMGDVSDMMHYDREMEQSLKDARSSVETLMADYELAQEEQAQIRGELDVRQNQLSGQVTAAASLIANLDQMGEAAQEEYAAIEEAEAQAMREEAAAIEQLEREREAARQAAIALANANAAAAAAAANGGTASAGGYAGTYAATYGNNVNIAGSGLIWPVDSKYVSSLFGNRASPTAGASSYHSAIDIGAAAGSPIYAAASGQVAVATYNNGLGNYVTIAHDGGTSTRYSHMTNYVVQPGQYVTQGQIIGYVGQTGIATGDHLDYAVMVNGQAVDPLQYYDTSGMTIMP